MQRRIRAVLNTINEVNETILGIQETKTSQFVT